MLKGNSGCSVVRYRDLVLKISPNLEYNKRLWASFHKMRSDFSPHHKVPRSFFIDEGDTERAIIEMDFVDGVPLLVEFLQSPEKIIQIGSLILEEIRQNIKASRLATFEKSVLVNKLKSINMHTPSADALLPEEFVLPVGKCHGDLTFSNMIWSQDKLWYFDHLDCYIESPIMDVIKLFQDLVYQWSFRYLEDKHPTLAYTQEVAKLRNMIIKDELISPFLVTMYKPLQYINLARIVPYLTDSNDVNKIQTYLGELCSLS